MRVQDIIDDYDKFFDFSVVTPEFYQEIMDDLRRQGIEPSTPELRQAMYGHDVEREELELDVLRDEGRKRRAEIEKLEAEAARDRAASRREE